MERTAGRTVAKADREYWDEQAALDDAEPEPDDDETPLADSEGVYILPQPRADALVSGEPVHYADERGRSVFQRLPLTSTNNNGLPSLSFVHRTPCDGRAADTRSRLPHRQWAQALRVVRPYGAAGGVQRGPPTTRWPAGKRRRSASEPLRAAATPPDSPRRTSRRSRVARCARAARRGSSRGRRRTPSGATRCGRSRLAAGGCCGGSRSCWPG